MPCRTIVAERRNPPAIAKGSGPDGHPSERATAATISASSAAAGFSSRSPMSGASEHAASTSAAREAIRERSKPGA